MKELNINRHGILKLSSKREEQSYTIFSSSMVRCSTAAVQCSCLAASAYQRLTSIQFTRTHRSGGFSVLQANRKKQYPSHFNLCEQPSTQLQQSLCAHWHYSMKASHYKPHLKIL